jgi:predicted nucleic acid binding AN1-type Zn finger protein
MKKIILPLSLAATLFSGCGVRELMQTLECNKEAIQRSTCVIHENIEAIEAANKKIEENRHQLEEINKVLNESGSAS